MIDARHYRGVPVITLVPKLVIIGGKVFAYWPEKAEVDLTPEARFFEHSDQERVYDMTGIRFTTG